MTTITTPGLYYDVPAKDYHADPCIEPSLSRGLAITLLTKSALHAHLEHPKLGGKSAIDEPTKEMDFGSVGHALLLGRGETVEVGEWDDWRTNAAKDWRQKMREIGHVPILQKTYERALALEDGAKRELERLGLAKDFDAAKPEVVAAWQEEGHWLRVMFDKILFDGPTPEQSTKALIFDLKITDSAAPEACAKQIYNMGYDIQWFMYRRAITKLFPHLAGRTRMIFPFIENDVPFLCTPMELSGEGAMLAEKEWERAFAKWKECRATNVWPPYTAGILRAEPPPWKVNAALKREYEAGANEAVNPDQTFALVRALETGEDVLGT